MSIARHHAEWLSLLEISGPFLSMPVLMRAFPQGLDAHDPDLLAGLRAAAGEWEESKRDPAIHRAWVRWVLREALGLPDNLLIEDIPSDLTTRIAEHGETLRPDLALANPTEFSENVDPVGASPCGCPSSPCGCPPGGPPSAPTCNQANDARKPRMLITILPPDQDPDREMPGRHWKATPASRMMELLHATGVRMGLVTNGERWMLVDAPRGETTGFISWYASLWLEEHLTLRAFRSLLGARRWFGVASDETLEALLTASASDQQEVTDQLGRQVRKAVEILIQALDRIDKDRGRALLKGVDEKGFYDAAVTVMMRLVFLLSVEERGLLPENPLYDQHYAISTLRAQLREAADQGGEEVLERRHDAWSRLLAAFRAVHGGVEHDAMRLPAYGGTLFDPDRYPFLEGRRPDTHWRADPAKPLPIHNRTVLHLLEALQMLQVRVPGGGPAEARLLSFRALDIEQIGHVYESLLDHTAFRAAEPTLALQGSKEPEIPLSRLEELREKGGKELLNVLKEETGRSEKAIARALEDAAIDEQRLRAACDNDESLLARVRPFAGLFRLDTAGYPVVITADSVYVTQGSDRRSTGTHYTPRSLTEPIVRYTLEPLVYEGPAEGRPKEEWRLRSPKELLDLKICDMAMGSGAFLVQACRYLAERLAEAWEEAEMAHPGQVAVTPAGELSAGSAGERPIPSDPEERLAVARRIVADRCLYGVDVNPMAMEMAKLSLWLVTLQKDRPFTFLDHALRCGDSLLGVDVEQLSNWSMEGRRAHQAVWLTHLMEEELRHALRLRRRITEMPDVSVRDTEEKARLLAEAEASTDLIRLGADLLLAIALADRRRRGALQDSLLWRYQLEVTTAQERRASAYQAHVLEEDRARLAELRAEADRLLGSRRPFHWPLEFPEVFVDPDALGTPIGFDALLGNPPFMGGSKITGAHGSVYRDYLVTHLASGQRGFADLCAYFFLRARHLLRPNGHLGLVATNTIAQGDTREVALDRLVGAGCSIMRAVPSRRWPGSANLEVAHVWIRRGLWSGTSVLGDEQVDTITPFLTADAWTFGTPRPLMANEGKAFKGVDITGIGFVVHSEEADALILKNPCNRDVLFPFLNGDDVNSRPDQSPSRWVINFHDWPIEQAETYSDCMEIVRKRVKPERDRNNRRVYRDRWWQYGEKRPELSSSIAALRRVLVRTRVSEHHMLTFVPTGRVMSDATIVFALTDYGSFGLLQSTIHETWARHYASSLETRMRYTPTSCLETFPFPVDVFPLAACSEQYYVDRAAIMLSRNEGLTRTYNRFHNPNEAAADIARLRELHVEMDRAVAGAYGWSDLDLGHGFHETKQGLRFTISEEARREVLGRLLRLNHERYEEEVRQGLHEKRGQGKGRKKAETAAGTLQLFGAESS